jgi:hypothetical protein
MRFPQAFRSDDAWFAINRFGGKRLILWSMMLILIGLASFWLPLESHPGWAITLGIAPLVFVLLPGFETWRFARCYEPKPESSAA